MQASKRSVECVLDFPSARFGGVVPSLPQVGTFSNGGRICRSSIGTFHDKLSDQLYVREYGASLLQQQMQSMFFDAIPSSTLSYSPPHSPPMFDFKPGMRDVPAWLKSLRLHKYTAMFAELNYEQMIALDEAELERRNVTKGARTKILQSIRKLNNRASDLRAMHETLSLTHPQRCLRCAIATLRQTIATPMIPYKPLPGESADSIDGFVAMSCISDQNVPGLIFNLLGHVQKAVFVSGRQPMDIEYEYLLMLFTIFDRLCNNEAFTPMQRQRVQQWKRLARKALRPTDVRRRRVGLPHSGKCEICHYKDIVCRENGKLGVKSSGTSSDKMSFHHAQQYQFASPMFNKHLSSSNRDWSHLVRISPPPPSPMVVQQHRRQSDLNSPQWNPCFSMDGSNVQKTRSLPMAPLNAQVFTQRLPQYRSQRHFDTGEATDSVPLLSSSSQSYEGSTRWPRAIYENNEFLADGNIARGKLHTNNALGSSGLNLWDSLTSPCSTAERIGSDSTSGYSSSTSSDRSSGAGSPRANGTGQTLYDRVCRDMAVLQLSI